MTDREVRIARTESLFRDVNERIAESAERFDADSTEFVCECSDQACTERVEATLDEYQEVRATVKSLTSLIEPLMITVMGFVVGFIVLAVFLPIIQLQKIIGK